MKGGSILPILLVGVTPLLVIAVIVFGVSLGLVRWEPPSLWSTEFGTSGGPGSDVRNRVTSISVDVGSLYGAGYVGGHRTIFNVNATPSQLFVDRRDLSGHVAWSRPLSGNPDLSEISGVAGVADGVYVVGGLEGNGFIEKYDSQGNLAWSVNLTSPSSLDSDAYAVSVGTTGVYVAASNLFLNSSRVFTLRGFDFEGNTLWTERINVATSGLYAASNGLYVSGNGPSGFIQRYDFSGVLQWSRQFTCPCQPVGISGDGSGIYLAGTSSIGAYVDAFVAKYDWDGNQVWIHESLLPYTLVFDVRISVNTSGVYVALVSQDQGSILSKYDANGNRIWSFHTPFSPYAISADNSSVYVGGDVSTSWGRAAVLSQYSQASSLIFFGANPPFSFIIVGVLVAGVAGGLEWHRRRVKSRAKPGASPAALRGLPTDSLRTSNT